MNIIKGKSAPSSIGKCWCAILAVPLVATLTMTACAKPEPPAPEPTPPPAPTATLVPSPTAAAPSTASAVPALHEKTKATTKKHKKPVAKEIQQDTKTK